ncbi:MAG: alpha/beta fold hydrolase [Dehalococcoidia bacterium]
MVVSPPRRTAPVSTVEGRPVLPLTALRIASGDLTLAGELRTPEGDGPFPAAVVCHPHPRMGGDMDNNVVLAAVDGLLKHGIAALRFNFRGSGESEGSHDDGNGEQDDVHAALAHAASLPALDAKRLGLAGYSFGAGMAAAAATEAIPALALIALPLGMGRDPSETLAAYPNPMLLMAGDMDQFCEAGALEELGGALGARAKTRIVDGADHFWLGFEREVSDGVGEFFAAQL